MFNPLVIFSIYLKIKIHLRSNLRTIKNLQEHICPA